jgi:hypothetical protein
MVIKLNTSKKINEDGTRIILTDSTGNVGDVWYEVDENDPTVYISKTNTTGYGEPNPSREEFALFIHGLQLGAEKDTIVEFDKYSPLTVTDFQAKAPNDGIYKFYLIYIPIVSEIILENYEEGDVVYDITDNKIYVMDAQEFKVIEHTELLNTKYCSPSVEFIHLLHNGKLFTQLVSKRVDLRMASPSSNKDIGVCTSAIKDVKSGIYAATYEYCKGNKLMAISIINSLNNKDYTHVLHL